MPYLFITACLMKDPTSRVAICSRSGGQKRLRSDWASGVNMIFPVSVSLAMVLSPTSSLLRLKENSSESTLQEGMAWRKSILKLDRKTGRAIWNDLIYYHLFTKVDSCFDTDRI